MHIKVSVFTTIYVYHNSQHIYPSCTHLALFGFYASSIELSIEQTDDLQMFVCILRLVSPSPLTSIYFFIHFPSSHLSKGEFSTLDGAHTSYFSALCWLLLLLCLCGGSHVSKVAHIQLGPLSD